MDREELSDKLRRWLPDAVEQGFSFSDAEVDAVNATEGDAQERVIFGIMARILEEAADECRLVESGESY